LFDDGQEMRVVARRSMGAILARHLSDEMASVEHIRRLAELFLRIC